MVEEVGTVIQKRNGQARVRLNRTEKCAGCHGCLLAEGGNYLIVKAFDPLGAAIGDRVKIQAEAGSAAKSGFILYIIPLISLLFGYFTGSKLVSLMGSSSTQGWGILSALLFMALAYVVIYLIQKRLVDKHSQYMRVVKILKNAEPKKDSPMYKSPVSHSAR